MSKPAPTPFNGNEWSLIFANKRIVTNQYLDQLLKVCTTTEEPELKSLMMIIWRGMYDSFQSYETYCSDLEHVGKMMQDVKAKYYNIKSQRDALLKEREMLNLRIEQLMSGITEGHF
jgi:hypothetical protein